MPVDPAGLTRLCDATAGWPRPGGGATGERLTHLARAARADLVLGRLVEAHADASAILAELGGPPVSPGQRWGVWAAGPPAAVRATPVGNGWELSGTKHWCSGATLLTHALIDAATDDGQRLFALAVEAPFVVAGPAAWVGPGMAAADTRSVELRSAPARSVGQPGDYLSRPGFWAGAVGVAACWLGGAQAVGDRLFVPPVPEDPYFAVHVAAVHVALTAGRAVLGSAADTIDAGHEGDFKAVALTARSTVERVATTVMDRVGRALGPGPLAHDAGHAATVADLTVYIRQHHAERDLAELGRVLLAAGRPAW